MGVQRSKHLVYPNILHRNRYIGPWSRADAAALAVYIISNGYCAITYNPESLRLVGQRAATLSLLNLIPLFAGPCLAFFPGPHGITAPVDEYETVIMVVDGFGLTAHLPYLKKLTYRYNVCKTRVHLIWQLETIGEYEQSEAQFLKG